MSKFPAAAAPFLVAIIKDREGCKLEAYLCPAKVWTIGYGHTKGVKKGDKITQAQAEAMLVEDMQEYWEKALRFSPNLVSASPKRQAAVTDFVYNCGDGNYQGSSFRTSVNAGDWVSAAANCKKWNKARVNGVLKVLNGLVIRRDMEAKLLLDV